MRIVKNNYKRYERLAWIRRKVIMLPMSLADFISERKEDPLTVAYEIPASDEIVGSDIFVNLVYYGYDRKEDLKLSGGAYNQKEFTENRPSEAIKFSTIFMPIAREGF